MGPNCQGSRRLICLLYKVVMMMQLTDDDGDGDGDAGRQMMMMVMLADATTKREKREKMSKLCDSMVVSHYGTSIGSPTAIFSFGCELFLLPPLLPCCPPPLVA